MSLVLGIVLIFSSFISSSFAEEEKSEVDCEEGLHVGAANGQDPNAALQDLLAAQAGDSRPSEILAAASLEAPEFHIESLDLNAADVETLKTVAEGMADLFASPQEALAYVRAFVFERFFRFEAFKAVAREKFQIASGLEISDQERFELILQNFRRSTEDGYAEVEAHVESWLNELDQYYLTLVGNENLDTLESEASRINVSASFLLTIAQHWNAFRVDATMSDRVFFQQLLLALDDGALESSNIMMLFEDGLTKASKGVDFFKIDNAASLPGYLQQEIQAQRLALQQREGSLRAYALQVEENYGVEHVETINRIMQQMRLFVIERAWADQCLERLYPFIQALIDGRESLDRLKALETALGESVSNGLKSNKLSSWSKGALKSKTILIESRDRLIEQLLAEGKVLYRGNPSLNTADNETLKNMRKDLAFYMLDCLAFPKIVDWQVSVYGWHFGLILGGLFHSEKGSLRYSDGDGFDYRRVLPQIGFNLFAFKFGKSSGDQLKKLKSQKSYLRGCCLRSRSILSFSSDNLEAGDEMRLDQWLQYGWYILSLNVGLSLGKRKKLDYRNDFLLSILFNPSLRKNAIWIEEGYIDPKKHDWQNVAD